MPPTVRPSYIAITGTFERSNASIWCPSLPFSPSSNSLHSSSALKRFDSDPPMSPNSIAGGVGWMYRRLNSRHGEQKTSLGVATPEVSCTICRPQADVASRTWEPNLASYSQPRKVTWMSVKILKPWGWNFSDRFPATDSWDSCLLPIFVWIFLKKNLSWKKCTEMLMHYFHSDSRFYSF